MTPEEIQTDAAEHAILLDRVRDASRGGRHRARAVADDAVAPRELPPAPDQLGRMPGPFASREEECEEMTRDRTYSRMRREMRAAPRSRPTFEDQ